MRTPSQQPPAPLTCNTAKSAHTLHVTWMWHLRIRSLDYGQHVIVETRIEKGRQIEGEWGLLMIHRITVTEPLPSDRWCHDAVMHAEALWHYSDPPRRPSQCSSCTQEIWLTCFLLVFPLSLSPRPRFQTTTETLRLICQIGAGLFRGTLFNKHTCKQVNDYKDKIR